MVTQAERELHWKTQQKRCGYGGDSLQASDGEPTIDIEEKKY